MSVTIREYQGQKDVWEVDIRVLLPSEELIRERKKAPVSGKSAAQRRAEGRERELVKNGKPKPVKNEEVATTPTTLREFAPRFIDGHAEANRLKPSGQAAYRSTMRIHLIPALGDKPLGAITTEDVQRLKSALHAKSPKTVNNVLTVLNVLMKTAVTWGVLERVPCAIKLLRVQKSVASFYDFDDYERLVEAARADGDAAYLIALLGGDPGVIDKRKLVVEGEFASVLKQFAREGNTLSPVLRSASDSGTLGTLTKSNTAKATGALISIIGHVTKDELVRCMNATEAGNGFWNRILWTCTTRSKLLPEGGDLHRVDFGPVVRRLQAAVAFANQDLELRRNESAKQLWAKVYPALSEGQPGMFGAMTSRAEAQVLRIAGIYAVADMSEVVTTDHLEAALEVWRYCAESVAFIFGTSLGDPVADEIDSALRGAGEEGLTRTDLRDLFGRNKKGDQIDRGLGVLEEHGRARRRRDQSRPGRPVQRWIHSSYDRNDQTRPRDGAKGVYVVGRNNQSTKTPVSTNDTNDITPIGKSLRLYDLRPYSITHQAGS